MIRDRSAGAVTGWLVKMTEYCARKGLPLGRAGRVAGQVRSSYLEHRLEMEVMYQTR